MAVAGTDLFGDISVSAFFFGPADRQLFGYYHAPRGAGARAAVICPSWGPEYQYAHRALRVTAKRLAERGFHVLRFDYSGVGDSWGDSTVGDIAQWRQDIALAIAELKAMSGQARVDLIGLRLGALLAVATAAGRSDVGSILLWEPVTDGAHWVGDLNRSRPASIPRSVGTIEFAQRLVSATLAREFLEIGPHLYEDPGIDNVLVLRTQDGGGRVPERLEHLGNAQERFVEDASPWLEDTSIWSGQVPAKAVGAIVDWLGAV